MDLRNKLISFEGLDCSFKETNSKKLLQYLEQSGIKAKVIDFPQYKEESSVFVRNYLAGKYGTLDESDAYITSMFYILDQYNIWKLELEKLYKEGYTIIFDRFWVSNLYFQLAKCDNESTIDRFYKDYKKDEILNLVKLLELPSPDVTISMKMETENIIKLVKIKKSSNDLHESNVKFLTDVNYLFHEMHLPDYTGTKNIDIWLDNEDGIKSRTKIFSDIITKLEALE